MRLRGSNAAFLTGRISAKRHRKAQSQRGDIKMKTRFLTKAGMSLFSFWCLNICICTNAKESSAFEKNGQIDLIQSAKDMRMLAQLVNRNEEVELGVKAYIVSYRLTRDIGILGVPLPLFTIGKGL